MVSGQALVQLNQNKENPEAGMNLRDKVLTEHVQCFGFHT